MEASKVVSAFPAIDPTVGTIIVGFFSLLGVLATLYARNRKRGEPKVSQDQQMYNQINRFIDDQNADREYLKNELRQVRINQRMNQLEIEKQQEDIERLKAELRTKDERIDILQKQLDNEKRNNKQLRLSVEDLTAKLKEYQEKQ